MRGVGGRRHAGAGPRAHAPRGAALPRAAAGSGDGLPGLQPARRDRHVALAASARSSCARARPRRASPARRRTSRRSPPRRTSTASSWARSLRAGDQLRAAAQLVEAPGGHAPHLAHRAVVARATSSSSRTTSPGAWWRRSRCRSAARATPPTPRRSRTTRARTQLYLRANELARSYDHLPEARDLYQRCLELDPSFAPAWARLGRCHRVIGKFIDDLGRQRRRAPRRPSAARSSSTRAWPWRTSSTRSLEADTGQPRDALVRLLGEAARHGNDPELFAGLVHACRYCGLFEQSIAAHEEARRLDPNVATEHRADAADDGRPRPPARDPAHRERDRQRLGDRRDRPRARGPPRRGAGRARRAPRQAQLDSSTPTPTRCRPGSSAAPRTCARRSRPSTG